MKKTHRDMPDSCTAATKFEEERWLAAANGRRSCKDHSLLATRARTMRAFAALEACSSLEKCLVRNTVVVVACLATSHYLLKISVVVSTKLATK